MGAASLSAFSISYASNADLDDADNFRLDITIDGGSSIPIPEPSAVLLVGVAGIGMLVRRRR